jgi:hypothetical protein
MNLKVSRDAYWYVPGGIEKNHENSIHGNWWLVEIRNQHLTDTDTDGTATWVTRWAVNHMTEKSLPKYHWDIYISRHISVLRAVSSLDSSDCTRCCVLIFPERVPKTDHKNLSLQQTVDVHRVVRRRGSHRQSAHRWRWAGEFISLTRRPAALYPKEDSWHPFL